ncbi:small, acid-soluble spore protein, alpha/beta type [Cytobacillus sp. Hm23]
MSRSQKKLLVPEAREAVTHFKLKVMEQQGYRTLTNDANSLKYEIAKDKNIPLSHGYNGHITPTDAGKIGGQIGGTMVKELVKMGKKLYVNNKQ